VLARASTQSSDGGAGGDVTERNRDLDLRIHCIVFDFDTRFLARVTEATGGTLVTPLK